MSVSLSKLSGVFGLLSLLVFVGGAPAAPSLGYPAGRPYYGSGHQHAHVYRSYSPVYVTDATETRQSFSHDPAESAAVSSGAKVDKAAAPQASDSKPASEHATAAAQMTTRQSFSYQPSSSSRRGLRRSNHREAWQYQKTDSRRRLR